MRNIFLIPTAVVSLVHLALASEPADSQTGRVEGRVLFSGGAVPKGINVADTVIYLVGNAKIPPATPPPKNIPPVLDQRDIAFVPHVLPVLAGTKVEIRNSDAILHNVHTASQKNRAFNRAQLGNQKFEETFAAPEVIRVVCDIHSQMNAYIVVVPSPYFTKAGKNGTFTLADVPPGRYQLVAWAEKHAPFTTEVEIAAGKATQADVNLTHTGTTTAKASL